MRLIIADDHALFRQSLAGLLAARGHEVVAEAANGREAVDAGRDGSGPTWCSWISRCPSSTAWPPPG